MRNLTTRIEKSPWFIGQQVNSVYYGIQSHNPTILTARVDLLCHELPILIKGAKGRLVKELLHRRFQEEKSLLCSSYFKGFARSYSKLIEDRFAPATSMMFSVPNMCTSMPQKRDDIRSATANLERKTD